MPFTRPNLTSPFPRPATPRITAPVRVSGGPGAPLAAVLGGTNFLARIWLSFDPPTTALPTWIEVTGFVANNVTIAISHGRADGLADVNATTCSLTVDNSDGRWNPGNPNGAWYGLIHKGSWLKVDLLPGSGNLSDRFVGFITTLPTAFEGQYASTVVTASDRYGKLTNIPTLLSMVEHEVLADPNLAGKVKGYWSLHEGSGTLSFGDTSGAGARYLAATARGAAVPGTGMTVSSALAPGFDGLRTVTFAPPSVSQGTYLTAPVVPPTGAYTSSTNFFGYSYSGLVGTISLWFQATTTGVRQMIASLVDPIAQFAFTIFIDSAGILTIGYAGTTPTNPTAYPTSPFSFAPRLDDGAWHHIVVGMTATASFGGQVAATVALDGASLGSVGQTSGAGVTSGNLTQIIVGGGYDPAASGAVSCGAGVISDVAWYWGDLFGLGSTPTSPPDIASHYAAGANGFAGESTDQRVARVARYAGIPTPQALASSIFLLPQVLRYNPGKGPWTNLSPGAHTCGTQAIVGRSALEVMREAARTEAMPLFVDRSGYLAVQASTTRQNTSPAWTVDSRDLEKNTSLPDDFAYVLNQATITPNGQAAQTVVGAVGAASQAKYGIYTQGGQQSTASVSPIEAQSLGYSLIQQRADPPPRLAPVTVEAATLAGQAGYGNAWYDLVLATEISTAMRVTSMPSQAGGGSQDGIVEGWVETISAGQHTFAFSTSPVQGPTYQLDDAVLGHIDTDGSTLAVAASTGATSLLVATTGVLTGSPLWTTTAADFPFDVTIGAEQITVTNINSLGVVDGTFESGVAGWTVAAGTFTSAAVGYNSAKSGLLTASAGPSNATIRTTAFLPVTGGVIYTYAHWILLSSGAPSVQAVIDWYDAGSVFISTSLGGLLSPTTATPWTQQVRTSIAPANAAFAKVGAQLISPATGYAVLIDTATLSPQLFTVTRSVNGVVAAPAAGSAVALTTPLTLAY